MIRLLRHFSIRQDGVSAIEFALFAPIFLVILAATMDFGALIQTRSQLESALSNATSFAMASGQQMTADSAASLALNSAKALVGQAGDDVSATIVVNKGPQASYADGKFSEAGQSGPAAHSCPVRTRRPPAPHRCDRRQHAGHAIDRAGRQLMPKWAAGRRTDLPIKTAIDVNDDLVTLQSWLSVSIF